jgi:hypothetical protein
MTAHNVCNSNTVIAELLEREGRMRSSLVFENIRRERNTFSLPPLISVLNSENSQILWSKYTDTAPYFSTDSSLLVDGYVDLNEF